MRIDVHIDRMIFDSAGVELQQLDAIREALRTSLSRLIASTPPEAWQESFSCGSIRPLPVPLRSADGPAQLGTQIASSLRDGLVRAGEQGAP
jgi:hypothetical protein